MYFLIQKYFKLKRHARFGDKFNKDHKTKAFLHISCSALYVQKVQLELIIVCQKSMSSIQFLCYRYVVRYLKRALKMAFERNKGQRWPWTLVILVIFNFTLNVCDAFNVDVNSKVIHEAPRQSCDGDCMFGFSVAQHREQGQPW